MTTPVATPPGTQPGVVPAPKPKQNTTAPRAELLRRLLDPDAVVIFDGAMGTMLYSKGVFINQCYDELNVRAPDLVRDVHKAYVKAGAEVLETNSFA